MDMTTTIRIEASKHKQIRLLCLENKLSMAEFIRQAIDEKLSNKIVISYPEKKLPQQIIPAHEETIKLCKHGFLPSLCKFIECRKV